MIPELLQDPVEVVVRASVCPPEIQLEASMFRKARNRHSDWKGNTSGMRDCTSKGSWSGSGVPDLFWQRTGTKDGLRSCTTQHSGTAPRTFRSSASSPTLSTGSTIGGVDVSELDKEWAFRLER
jgi:hypothetical protein